MRNTNVLLLLPSSLLFKNMARWGLSQSPDCSFCLNPESLFHVVGVCQQHLDRFTWRHDSILNFIAKSLQPVINVHSSLQGSKFKFEFGTTCATRCKFLGALPKF